jgi:hypothetical protein
VCAVKGIEVTTIKVRVKRKKKKKKKGSDNKSQRIVRKDLEAE